MALNLLRDLPQVVFLMELRWKKQQNGLTLNPIQRPMISPFN